MTDTHRTVEATWRIEGAQVVATLARVVGDVGLAEDLAQEAIADALTQWPESGVPRNAGAWLTAVAKRKAIDGWRRQRALDERYQAIAHDLSELAEDEWEPIEDDMLRLIFTTCHPALSRQAQVCLTLLAVGGLTTEEIARVMLAPLPTVQQRIVRAKATLSAAQVPFTAPDPSEWSERLGAVLGTVYLIFTEGYAATTGSSWIRPELAREALRLGRTLSHLLPREAEVHGLLALMEIQASRFAARVAPDGSPITLAEQDRSRWDYTQIRRGRDALARAAHVGRGLGSYGLQAAIAECHTRGKSAEDTPWERIVILYEALSRLAPSQIVDLNRAIALSMTSAGPAPALVIVDELNQLADTSLLRSVRGELLARLDRTDEARAELIAAAELATNERQAAFLRDKASAL